MLFAHLKRILNLTRLRLRGMNGAHDEFLPPVTGPESAANGEVMASTAI